MSAQTTTSFSTSRALIRQGNEIAKKQYNNEVPIFAYATELSLDAYKYDLNRIKETFLKQVKSGNTTERVLKEGGGQDGVGNAELTAILSGNKDIVTKAKLEDLVAKLKRQKRSYEGDYHEATEKIEKIRTEIPLVESHIKKSEENVKAFTEKAQYEEVEGGRKLVIDSFNGEKLKPKTSLQYLRCRMR